MMGDINRLVSFGTRHPRSPVDDPRVGTGAARGWLFGAFQSLDGTAGNQVLVTYEDFSTRITGRRTTQRNIISTLPGIGLSKRFIYVTAHYDSRAADERSENSSAPGADNNASGVAALLELSRILAERRWDATIRAVAFAASEFDQEGSAYHAPRARETGLPIVGVFNNDTIGSGRGPDGTIGLSSVRVFSDGPEGGPSRQLARYAQAIGGRYSKLEVVVVPAPDRDGRRSDHLSFSDEGLSAIRVIEANEDATRQNNARDTVDRMDAGYLADVVKLNLALVANLALAPSAPSAAPELAEVDGQPAALLVTWAKVRDPMVAGYWVAVRGHGDAAYRDLKWAGNVDSYVLTGLQVGEPIAVAVAASDDRGHTSVFGPEAATQ
jgi:hypothetical protein